MIFLGLLVELFIIATAITLVTQIVYPMWKGTSIFPLIKAWKNRKNKTNATTIR